MAFLFGGKKAKSPADLTKSLKETLALFDKPGLSEKNMQKAVEEISKTLTQMKVTLYGDNGVEPNAEQVAALGTELLEANVLEKMVQHLDKYEFEAKKDAAQVFNNVLRKNTAGKHPLVEQLTKQTRILELLLVGYEVPDIGLNCGSMLRECIRHEPLARILLYSEHFYKFFKFVELSNFDLSSDAFATFKDLLTKHKAIVAEFLEANYDAVFEQYTLLLKSENYVTRRQSLKLLGELLLDRANFNIMTRYIANQDNLKLMMNLLRDKSKSIQFEAFHVFKVFVANPNKTQPITDILVKNKEKLVQFLSTFQNEKAEDEQFMDEKAFLLKQIQAI